MDPLTLAVLALSVAGGGAGGYILGLNHSRRAVEGLARAVAEAKDEVDETLTELSRGIEAHKREPLGSKLKRYQQRGQPSGQRGQPGRVARRPELHARGPGEGGNAHPRAPSP